MLDFSRGKLYDVGQVLEVSNDEFLGFGWISRKLLSKKIVVGEKFELWEGRLSQRIDDAT